MATRHYFVDEAGDPILYGRRRRVVLGQAGCSSHFVLGVLDVVDPVRLASQLTGLRKRLLADPYFAGVPSMSSEGRKTAVAFHAKDDVPEVRREVFGLLLRSEVRLLACVRDKSRVLHYVRQREAHDPGYRYDPNELYDWMVRRLFKTLLHKDDSYEIAFAARGTSDRTEALKRALFAARSRFTSERGIQAQAAISVQAASPVHAVCLQAADYFLWALQRLYERGEDRFVRLLWPAFRLVIDADDTRAAQSGAYYTQRNPLTKEALAEAPDI